MFSSEEEEETTVLNSGILFNAFDQEDFHRNELHLHDIQNEEEQDAQISQASNTGNGEGSDTLFFASERSNLRIADHFANALNQPTSTLSIQELFKSAPFKDDDKNTADDSVESASAAEDLMSIDGEESRQHHAEIIATMDMHLVPKRKRNQMTKKIRTYLNHEGNVLLAQANSAFFGEDYDAAKLLLQQVIQLCPHAHEPYRMMATIHEDQGETEKAVLFYMIAAHLRPSDVELWKKLALLSRDMNLLEQASYCLGKALKEQPDDREMLIERALLYTDLNQISRALNCYESVLKLEPSSLEVVQEMAKLYMEQDNVKKAIQLFERTFLVAIDLDEDATLPPSEQLWQKLSETELGTSLTFDQLHVYVELLMLNRKHRKAMQTIQEACKMILGRHFPNQDFSFNSVPLDLRVKYAICGIYLRVPAEEYEPHLELLYRQNLSEVLDLYFDVAEAFHFNRDFGKALPLFEKMIGSENPEYDQVQNWMRLAECYHALERFEPAANWLKKVLDVMPNQKQVSLMLADCFDAFGEEDHAIAIRSRLDATKKPRRKLRGYRKAQQDRASNEKNQEETGTTATEESEFNEEEPSADDDDEDTDDPLFRPDDASSESSDSDQSVDDHQLLRVRLFEQKSRQHQIQYDEVCDLLAKFNDDSISHDEAVRLRKLLKGLVVDFQHCDRFYRDRIRPFNAERQSKKLKEIRRKAGYMSSSDDESGMDEPEPFSGEATSYYGLDFEDWLKVNIRYAEVLTKTAVNIRSDSQSQETIDEAQKYLREALSVVKKAVRAGIFYYNRQYLIQLKILIMSIALIGEEFEEAYAICRWFMLEYPTSTDVYRMLSVSFCSGADAMTIFADVRTQKFMIRQLRMSQVQNPHMWMLAGHIYMNNRSYMHALKCYLHAYNTAPNDPLVLFCIGIGFLHRSTQRKTENRHQDVLQAITFLQKYLKIRSASDDPWLLQEARYNLGRAMHGLNLTTLALEQYEKVLEISQQMANRADPALIAQYDLRFEAVYNMSYIYAIHKSPLGQQLIDNNKY